MYIYMSDVMVWSSVGVIPWWVLLCVCTVGVRVYIYIYVCIYMYIYIYIYITWYL